ncbi:MAG TPA: hypothetical protein VIT90_15240 [Lysobacter sp.]
MSAAEAFAIDELLTQARKAWAAKLSAEGDLARLRRYKAMTEGMKRDQARHLERLNQANATLARVLGAAA